MHNKTLKLQSQNCIEIGVNINWMLNQYTSRLLSTTMNTVQTVSIEKKGTILHILAKVSQMEKRSHIDNMLCFHLDSVLASVPHMIHKKRQQIVMKRFLSQTTQFGNIRV